MAISRRTRRVDVVAQFEEDGSRGILNKDWVHHGKSEACGWSANIREYGIWQVFVKKGGIPGRQAATVGTGDGETRFGFFNKGFQDTVSYCLLMALL